MVKSEEDALDLGPGTPAARRSAAEAVQALEQKVLDTPGIEGVALRYGALYGPGTAYAADGAIAAAVGARAYAIVGAGSGVTSFLHIDDAATATVLAFDAPPGVYNICDDSPAPLSSWLPYYATALGAPEPRRLTGVLARIRAGEFAVYLANEQRGAANDQARRRLGFRPSRATWREGFTASLGEAAMAA